MRKGSKFHKVQLVNDRAFSIRPIDDGLNALRQFQDIAVEAIDNATADYEVVAHPQKMVDLPGWSGPIYDFVAITKIS